MAEKIVAGNWKMNLRLKEARSLFTDILDNSHEYPEDVGILIIPPFPYIEAFSRELPKGSNISLGAQDCHEEKAGAFTGEVAAEMIRSVGGEYCIVGHSERRNLYGETDELVKKKMIASLEADLHPILCIGESLDDRDNGTHFEKVDSQLRSSILSLSRSEAKKVVVAYEPVWAIGTGRSASPEQAQEMHAFIRQRLEKGLNKDVAQTIPLLYGGSCKPNNAADIFKGGDVDGGLIGGASLKEEDFKAIIDAAG